MWRSFQIVRLVSLLLVAGCVLLLSVSTSLAQTTCIGSYRSCSGNPSGCCAGLACGSSNTCVSGCRINSVFYSPNATNPANRCQSCQPGASTTSWTSLANGATCNDGNACTTQDKCQGGTCGGTPLSCNDNSVCTQDTCDPARGCVHTSVTCNDYNACTDDSCDTTRGCTYRNNTKSCSDGNACTTGDVCNYGTCRPGTGTLNCNDNNACTDDRCDPAQGCVRTNNYAACNDNNSCTVGDACSGGTCRPGASISCDDYNPCTNDTCDRSRGCLHTNNTSSCSDGNSCTTGDKCSYGTCKPGTSTVTCNDYNPCTDDSCDPARGCVYTNNTRPCNDNNTCTTGDACSGGSCRGAPRPCDDYNPCTDDSCDPARGCVYTNNYRSCDDHNACTTGDSCSGGYCRPGTGTRSCDDYNPCTDDRCDPATGCVNAPNYSPCDDQDACTTGDTCSGGYCRPGTGTRNCDDYNPCTDDRCDPATGCVNAHNYSPCDDHDACTTGDTCSGGYCRPGTGTRNCDDYNPCTDDRCDPATGCVYAPNYSSCDDHDACTTGDTCSGGYCRPGTAQECDDYNPCTDDRCDPASGCVYTPNTDPCNDDDGCTTGDTCAYGTCHGGSPPDCDDGNPCTDDACTRAGGAKTQGFYRRLCAGPHPEDELTQADVDCVNNSATFASVQTLAELCSRLNPDPPNNKCEQAESQFMTLLLNRCRNRVLDAQTVDSDCPGGGHATVGETIAHSDSLLANPGRTRDDCAEAQCEDDEINSRDESNTNPPGNESACTHTPNTGPCDDGNACTRGDTCVDGRCVSDEGTVEGSAGPIVIFDDTTAVPYPSSITIPSGAGQVVSAEVTITGLTHTYPEDVDMLLVGPTGANALIFTGVGGAFDVVNVTVVLSDSAATPLPYQAQLTSGTFQPTNWDGVENLPPPAPASAGGSALSVFNGTSASGTWSLYVRDELGQDTGSITSWSLKLFVDPCGDGNPCTDDTCDPATGHCVSTPDDTNACSDGNECTTESCVYGWCVGSPITCDDQNPCTDDTCDPATGCVYTPDDTNQCTNGALTEPACMTDACVNGQCVPTPITCDDQNPCTDDACDPTLGHCVYTPDDTNTCTDDNACTEDLCRAGHCVSSAPTASGSTGPIAIRDLNTAVPYPSTILIPAVNGRVLSAEVTIGGLTHTFPDDLDLLLVGPTGENAMIMSGAGGGNDVVNVTLVLSDSAATPLPNSTALASGSYRPANYDGQLAIPAPAPSPPFGSTLSVFNGTDPAGTWSLHVYDDASGDTGSITTWSLRLVLDPCDDGNPCTDDTCDPTTGCVSTPNDQNACNDRSHCTTDACVNGQCVGTPITCDDGNPCTDDTCDPALGCVYTPDDTNTCDDGNACTSEICVVGQCTGHQVNCDDGNPCTVDTCEPSSGCVYTNNSGPCDDLNSCTTGDTCRNGRCQPTSGNFIQNPGFETGDFTGWSTAGTSPPATPDGNPHSGTYAAEPGSGINPFAGGEGVVFQEFTVPALGADLSFWVERFTIDSIFYDWQDAYITDTSNNVLAVVYHTCQSSPYTNIVFPLSAYAGQVVRVNFLVHQDAAGDPTGQNIDDVAVTCTPPAPCTPGFDPVNATPWVVCTADAYRAWISGPFSDVYNAEAICRTLGYATLGQFGATCGSECGTCEGATSCADPGTESYDGTRFCGIGEQGPALCGPVHWECIR